MFNDTVVDFLGAGLYFFQILKFHYDTPVLIFEKENKDCYGDDGIGKYIRKIPGCETENNKIKRMTANKNEIFSARSPRFLLILRIAAKLRKTLTTFCAQAL